MLSQELQELNAEIEAELPVEFAAPAIVAAEVKTLGDLDDLLAESMTLREDRNAGKGLREKLARAKDHAEAQETELLLRAWEAKYEWRTKAECVVFHQQQCTCGSVHTHMAGVYFHQTHRSDPHAQRWISASDNIAKALENGHSDLEKQSYFEAKYVTVCADCAQSQGYPMMLFPGVPWK